MSNRLTPASSDVAIPELKGALVKIACKVYPEISFGGFSRFDGRVLFYSRLQALAGDLKAGTLLDIGCGRGRGSEDRVAYRRSLQDLRCNGRTVIGIDPSNAGANNPHVDDFRVLADLRRWPVEDNSVDLAWSDCVLEHVDDVEAFFSELKRVLKPGGVAAVLTPNRLGYVSLIASMIPNRAHAAVLGWAQKGRKEEDVFPTLYRCNTARRVRKAMASAGFTSVAAYTVEAEPSYFGFSRIAYRLMAVLHRLIPGPFRNSLHVFARL